MKKLAVLLILFTITAVVPVFSQDQFAAPPQSGSGSIDDSTVRKRTKFWRGPKKKDAAAQLVYARKLEDAGRKRKARKQYNALVRKWHESPEAVHAQYSYAKLLEEKGKYKKAFDEYQYMAIFYAGRFNHTDLLTKQMSLADKTRVERHIRFLLLKGITSPGDAIPMYEKIIKNAPEWEHADEALFNIASIKEELGDYSLARDSYDKLLQFYLKSELVDSASFHSAYCSYIISNKSPRDKIICRDALSAQADYLNNYAQSKDNVAKTEKYMVELKTRLAKMYYDTALFYDKSGHLKSALIAYNDLVKKFPGGTLTSDAIKRIDYINAELERRKNE